MGRVAVAWVAFITAVVSGSVSDEHFKRFATDKLIGGYMYKQDGVMNLIRCAIVCQENMCHAYSFHRQTRECFVYNKLQLSNSESPFPGLITFVRKGQCVYDSYTLFKELGLCLKVCDKFYDWSVAKTHCETYGGQLMILKPYSETKSALHTLSLSSTYVYWLGGKNVNSTWTWVDGELTDLNNGWAFGEPNSGTIGLSSSNAEFCMVYNPVSDRLYDRDCIRPYKFVCEMQVA